MAGPADAAREQLLRVVEGRGELNGRFRDIKRLGSIGGTGAFSLIFTAVDSHTGEDCIVKVFNPFFGADAYRAACFQREAELLGELGEDYRLIRQIAPLSEFQEVATFAGGLPIPFLFRYFVMERASQSALDAIMLDRWSVERRLVVFREMVKIVQRLHRDGVAHRDIKPANFLEMPNGELVMGDLGTMRRLSDPPLLPSYAGQPPGDIRYTPPEVLASLHDDDPAVSKRADCFALGAILFEFFAGTRLTTVLYEPGFAKELMETMQIVRKGARKEVYDGAVGAIADARPLPSVADGTSAVPGSIRPYVDRVYRELAALDYRKRPTSYESTFRLIEIALIVHRNEERYQAWRQRRRRLRGIVT